MTLPVRIINGTTSSCRLSCGYTPREGWALTLALRGPGEPAEVAGVADGDDFLVTLPVDLSVGRWWWQARVTDGTDTHIPLAGELLVEENLFDQGADFDGRSEARRALDAIEAVLANKASQDQQSYTIKGRSLSRYPVADLLRLRAFYVTKVRREQGRSGFRTIGARF